jgi:hypothetical protein
MRIICPECETVLEHPDHQVGQRVQCWGCSARIEASAPVPAPEAEVALPSIEPPESSPGRADNRRRKGKSIPPKKESSAVEH